MAKPRNKQDFRQKPHGGGASAFKPVDLSLDGWTKDILHWVALLLLRRVSRRQWNVQLYKERLKQWFAKMVDSVPDWVGDEAGGPEVGDDIAGAVQSRWHLDPRFTRDGKPKPLPEKGRVSLYSLIRGVSESADPKEVIRQMILTQSINIDSGLYRLTGERRIRLRNVPWMQLWHHVRLVRLVLKTVEGNARRLPKLRRFEFMSVGPVPKKEYSSLSVEFEAQALGCLTKIDNAITESASAADMIEVGVAVVVVDERRMPALRKPDSVAHEDATR